MTIQTIPNKTAVQNEPKAAPQNAVINLDEIKSILYLGLKGVGSLVVRENHRIDTLA